MDLSVKETSICIVDDTGRIVREVKVASEPEALLAVLKNPAYHFKQIGLEAGPLSQWIYGALAEVAAWTASREGHYSTTWWSSSVLLSPLIFHASHAAAASSRVHRNSVPSTQMRCIITANRRASATIAFFIPRRLAIFIAQALSHDHFAERNRRLWAAS